MAISLTTMANVLNAPFTITTSLEVRRVTKALRCRFKSFAQQFRLSKKVAMAAVISILACDLFAQAGYQAGYLIANDGTRVECLFYIQDWLRSPVTFRYKLTSDSVPIEGSINDVREFSVGSNTFVRRKVKMDTSSQDIKNLSVNNDPEWVIRTVFLKRIVSGKATLFVYRDRGLELFFFSVYRSPVEQLVYKKYKLTPAAGENPFKVFNAEYNENLTYKAQLIARASCGKSESRANRARYQESVLKEYFEDYNRCNGAKPIRDIKVKKSLSLSGGWDFATLHMVDPQGVFEPENEEDPGYQFGIAGEFNLPFHRRKWSVRAEPTYQFTKSTNVNRSHKSVEIPIGIRHHFFISQDLKLFVNVLAVFDIPIFYEASEFVPSTRRIYIQQGLGGCVALGAGAKIDRFSVEGRFYTPRTYTDFNGTIQYNKASLILGFRIF
jgi:hypothetical protein